MAFRDGVNLLPRHICTATYRTGREGEIGGGNNLDGRQESPLPRSLWEWLSPWIPRVGNGLRPPRE